ncbi:MAG: fold metallo-hydrolase [Chloroflexi bacterium]|nr:fold metallo-hydrolase [Chloroflexota bacterium]
MSLPHGIEIVLAPNPSVYTGSGTNTVAIGTRDHGCVVVDPASESADHLDRLADIVTGYGGLSAILITHGHHDHLDGATSLRDRFEAPIAAWSREAHPGVDIELRDRQLLRAGRRTIEAIYTPGHRFDHLCFLLPQSQTLLAGDLVAGAGTVLISPPEGDMDEYLNSLRRVQLLRPACIVPGHGPVIEDTLALLADYIRHRQAREKSILDLIRTAQIGVDAITESVYAGLDASLLQLARQTVRAHMLKLQRDGAIERVTDCCGTDEWRRAS